MTTVGFVGAGRMGGPMVERLLAAGTPVRLYARRTEVRERFTALGAETVDTFEALDSDTVVVCLFDDAQLREVVPGLVAALPPGGVLVNHTTVGLQALDEVAAAVTGRGAELVDAPVSGTDDAIRAGRLSVLLGGSPDAVARADAVVAAYSDSRTVTGGVGSAARVKLINNVLFAVNLQTVATAIELGAGLGLTEAELVTGLSACSSASTALGYVRQFGSLDALTAKAGEYLRKDVDAAAVSAAAHGADLGLLGEVVRRGPLPFTQ